ncbi:MAG: hypothetical protein ABUL48_02225, partial [Pseudorhodoplanes sp.]
SIARRHNVDLYALAACLERGDPQTARFLKPVLGGDGTTDFASLLGSKGDIKREPVADYVAESVKRFARRSKLNASAIKAAILGGAGAATASLVANVAEQLKELGAAISVLDSGHMVHDIKSALANSNVIVNFADAHVLGDWAPSTLTKESRRLVFDASGSIDKTKVETSPGCVYATFGYITPPRVAVIACDNGFGHVRRCATIAAVLRDRGASCDLFAPPALADRLGGPIVEFCTHSNPEGWRRGTPETIAWQERLPDVDTYDFVLADSLPEILERRADAILIGHFLWAQILPDVDKAHVARVDRLLERYHPRMLGTGLLASDVLKAKTSYIDVGFFGSAEFDFLPTARNELLISSGLGAEPEALASLQEAVNILASFE